MKKTLKVFLITYFLLNIILVSSYVFADDPDTSVSGILGQGANFIKDSQKANSPNGDLGGVIADIIGTRGSGGILDAIVAIGNLTFMSIGVILGIKYVFSSVDGKAAIKESLIPYSIGAIFFYLPQTLFDFAKGILGDFAVTTSLSTISEKIWKIVSDLGNLCAVAAVVTLGLKYMLTSADEKAHLKEKMVPLIIGIAMIYCTLKVIKFIVTIGSGIFSTV
jgi:uncharacterized membrane protein YgdD (TMEM256/DUF423 family)